MHGKCGKQKKGRETTLTTRLRHRVTQKSSLKSLAIFGVLPLASIACERLCSGGGSLICIFIMVLASASTSSTLIFISEAFSMHSCAL